MPLTPGQVQKAQIHSQQKVSVRVGETMKNRRRSESRPTNADEDVRVIVGDDGENFVFIISRA